MSTSVLERPQVDTHGSPSTSTPNGEILPLTETRFDTIRLRAPVASYDQKRLRIFQEARPTGEVVERPTGATFMITPHIQLNVDYLSGVHSPMATWEFSVPRALRKENTRGSNLTEVREAVQWVYERAKEYVEWAVPAEDLRPTRLDMVNDFNDVTDISGVLRALAAQRGRRAGTPVVQISQDGHGGSVHRGNPKRWSVSAYDKGAEVAHSATRGRDKHRKRLLSLRAPEVAKTLRVETRLRWPILASNGILTMSMLNDVTTFNLGQTYRHRAGFDGVLVGSEDAPRALQALYNGPDRHHADAVLGFLWAECWGLPRPSDRKTTRARRDLAAKYSLDPSMLRQVTGPSIRLCFESNTVLVAEHASTRENPTFQPIYV